MYHFSQANSKGRDRGNIPMLLRRVASSIASLGSVEVYDITFDPGDVSEDGDEPSMTVYYELVDENGPPNTNRASRRRAEGLKASTKKMP
jgi:hypothetical protein